MKTLEVNTLNTELIRRFARKDRIEEDLRESLLWIANGELKQVTTQTAFQLAKGGREVFMVYEDGTDTMLDDLDHEGEYYTDLTKSWPEIETIFLVEGEL